MANRKTRRADAPRPPTRTTREASATPAATLSELLGLPEGYEATLSTSCSYELRITPRESDATPISFTWTSAQPQTMHMHAGYIDFDANEAALWQATARRVPRRKIH